MYDKTKDLHPDTNHAFSCVGGTWMGQLCCQDLTTSFGGDDRPELQLPCVA